MSSSASLYRYIFHGSRLSVASDAKPLLQTIKLNKDDLWATFNKGDVLSHGTTTCLRVKLPDSDDFVYFKRYRYTKNPWEFFLRRSKAANEYVNYQRFKKLGIPTLNTLALYEQRIFGRLNLACILTAELKNTMQLDDFYTHVLSQKPKNERLIILKDLKKALFEQIQFAHRAGIFHLDLKWRNILIQHENGQYTPIWIDCPRGIQRQLFNYRLKVADLSGLSRKALSFFTPQQLYRMLYLYLGATATKKEARKLFFDIKKHLERRPPKALRN